MSQFPLYAVTSIGLVCLGLFRLVTSDHLLRSIIALNVMGSGVFLLLVAVARRNVSEVPDPVPHAMVLTGIVVAVSVTGLALAIVRRIHDAESRAPREESGPAGSGAEKTE